MKKIITTVIVGLLIGGAAMADVFYLHADMPANSTPNDKTLWFDDPAGGTSQDVLGAPNTGNRFDMNGYGFRAATGTTHTFAGTLVVGESTLAMMYAYTWNLTGLDIDSGTLLMRPHQTSVNLNIANLAVGASGNLDIRTLTGNDVVNLSVANLSGSGRIGFGITYANDANGLWNFSVSDATPEFTGTVDLFRGELTFGSDFALNESSFTINSIEDNSIILANSVSFSNVVFGASSLSAGTYTAVELNAAFGTDRFSGTETLTVIPEAATIAMLGSGALGLLLTRRYFSH